MRSVFQFDDVENSIGPNDNGSTFGTFFDHPFTRLGGPTTQTRTSKWVGGGLGTEIDVAGVVASVGA